MLPLLATAMSLPRVNIYAGLWYPIIVALMSFVIGSLFIQETKDRDIGHEHLAARRAPERVEVAPASEA